MDASALVAMAENEDEGDRLFGQLRMAPNRLWSALSCWEAVSALRSRYERPIGVARSRVDDFAAAFDLRLVPIAAVELAVALDAYETYGKGRHRAKLNFGDCFAYACAKANNARLLYKGNDFAHTDLA